MKHLVNIVTFEKMSFPEQAMRIKVLYNKYKPKVCVIDGAGIGAGLVDELVLSQIDPETNSYLAPWGVANDTDGHYSQFKTSDSIPNLLYIVKANAPFNTQMYNNLQTQLLTGKLRFLVDEQQAKLRMEASRAKKFKDMTEDDKQDYIIPFYQASILKAQMINLEFQNEGMNIILKRANSGIKKDKVSSLGYVLYYIKLELDDREVMRRTMTLDQMLKAPARNNNKGDLSKRITFRGNRNYTSNMRKTKQK